MKVGCVIVTFNKKDLLKECLDALNNQTISLSHIIIIDNCSTDGTEAYIKYLIKKQENIHYHRLKQNIGGAGGFNLGLKEAYKKDVDYVWIMDDDTIPKYNALENLLKVAKLSTLSWGYLCSNVKWIDNSPCLMNIPDPSDNWNNKLDLGVVSIKRATFVSLLIPKNILCEVGLPIKEFFIWGDDTEFTKRINKILPGYLVIDSEVIHKMAVNGGVNIINDTNERLNRYYYRYRNKLYMARKSGFKEFMKFSFHTWNTIIDVLRESDNNKFVKIWTLIKGYTAGLFFNPEIEIPD